MRKRSWLVETCRAVLLGLVLIALGYGWHVWHKGQECYDRIWSACLVPRQMQSPKGTVIS